MKAVREYIEQSSRALGAHPFFAELQPDRDLRRMLAFAPVIDPWVMSFQDVIRINAERAEDPATKHRLGRHVLEDQGHEQWFLADLKLLFDSDMRDIAWMFGRETASAREATLAIAAEVFRIRDDHLRIVFVDALEAGSRTFIERVHHLVRQSDGGEHLRYFGRAHERAEAAHEMFEDSAESHAARDVLPDDVRDEAKAMVDRIFREFSRIAEAARRAPPKASADLASEP